MAYVFWASAIFLAYVFAGYPALLFVLAKMRGRPHRRQPIEPSVSLIVTAHNEERQIGKKILNCLALDYPREKREIIVASDGSNDRTAEIARSFEEQGVNVMETGEHRGKQHAQMLALRASRGDVIVFTDAGTLLEPESLRRIVANFADPAVGSVSSEDSVADGEGKAEQSYVNLEMRLRRMESRVSSVVSASGSFFAARRAACNVWHTDQTSDFFVPLNAVTLGMRSVVDPESVGRFEAAGTESAELARKIRTVVNGLHVFFSHLYLLHPHANRFFAWQLVSHKLFRWLTPFALLALFAASAFLARNGVFYAAAFVLQVLLYATGALALATGRVRRWKPTRLAGYFLLVNAATVMAWFSYLAGERYVTWQPTERN